MAVQPLSPAVDGAHHRVMWFGLLLLVTWVALGIAVARGWTADTRDGQDWVRHDRYRRLRRTLDDRRPAPTLR